MMGASLHLFVFTQALVDTAINQCPAFVVEACRSKCQETREIINGVNDILMNKDVDGAYNPQLDMILNYPSELKNFGSALVESTKSLSKMLMMIHQSRPAV